MASALDRMSPVPLWFQLAMLLERQIEGGVWRPGDQLPSEPELGRLHSLSRATVRQALRRLEQSGLIHREKGQGTFVRPSRMRSWLLQSSEGFFADEADRLGQQVDSRVLRREVAQLPDWAAEALDLPAGSSGVNVERLRSVDGLIALYVEEHLPLSLADAVLAMDAEHESLYSHLKRTVGAEVASARRVLQAVNAGDRLAGLLEVDCGDALVLIESVAWDGRMHPFHCFRTWLRTDRMRVEIQATPTHVTPARPEQSSSSAWLPRSESTPPERGAHDHAPS